MEECLALDSLLQDQSDAFFKRKTQFKQWTTNDILGHLAFWNEVALMKCLYLKT